MAMRNDALTPIVWSIVALIFALLIGAAFGGAVGAVVLLLATTGAIALYFWNRAAMNPRETHDGSHLMHLARREAQKRGHPAFGVEHLLRALILDVHGAQLLSRAGVDVRRLDASLLEWMRTAFQPPGAAPQELHYREGAQRPVVFHYAPTPAPALREAWSKATSGPPTVEALLTTIRGTATTAAAMLASHGLTGSSLSRAFRVKDGATDGAKDSGLAGATGEAMPRALLTTNEPRCRVMLRWGAGANLDAVIDVLMEELSVPDAEATRLALAAQDAGESQVAMLPRAEAESRAAAADRRARELGQPVSWMLIPTR